MDKAPPRRAPAKPIEQALEANAPWRPVQISDRAASCIKAMQRGEATPDMQKWLLRWIIYDVCDTYGNAYRPGSNDRDTNLALGKQFVGHQMLKHLNINLARIKPEGGNDE
jgi:hypothetical protein